MDIIPQAVILAGGAGSRLGPLTRYRPKPMLPVANQSVLDYVIDALLTVGIQDIIIVIGHRGNRIRDHLEHAYSTVDFTFVVQGKQLGTGHALRQAEPVIEDEFLLLNGDTIIDPSVIKETITQHVRTDDHASAAIVESNRPEDYGVIEMENGNIAGITENPSKSIGFLVNAGIYLLPLEIFNVLSEIEPRNGEYFVTDAVIELSESVKGVEIDGVWLDPSYPWDVLDVTETILASNQELLGERFVEGISIAESATVHPSSTIESPVVIGPDCEITAGAIVRNCTCLGPNTKVGHHSIVDRSITGSDTTIGNQVTLRNSILGDGTALGDGTVVAGGPADVTVNGQVYSDQMIGGIVSDRVTIGEGVVINAGVGIGPNATVAPGSRIQSDVPAESEVRG